MFRSKETNIMSTEDIISFSGKAIDFVFKKLDVKLLDGIPLGGIFSYLVKEIVEIKDKELAFRRAIACTYMTTFIEALAKHYPDLTKQQEKLNQKKALNSPLASLETFDMGNFMDNEIIAYQHNLYIERVEDIQVPPTKLNAIKRHVEKYLERNFYELIYEEKSEVYIHLGEYFNSKINEKQISIIRQRKYEKELVKRYEGEIETCNHENPIPLKDIYIEPNFKICKYAFPLEIQEKLKEEDEDFLKVPNAPNIHKYIYDLVNAESLHEEKHLGIKKLHNLIFVLGQPGQGKTSFCKRLLHDVYDGNVIPKRTYFLSLKEIGSPAELMSDMNPINILKEEVERELTDFLDHHQPFKDSLLVLDGLDEIAMQEGVGHEKIEGLCEDLIKATRNTDNFHIIITSRTLYLDLAKFKNYSTLILHLESFDFSQQQNWINKFRNFHPKHWLTLDKLNEFYNEDKDYKYIQEIIKEPLILSLISQLRQEVQEDMNRAGLYDKLFTELFNRRSEQLVGFDPRRLRRIIQEIAFEIFKSGREFIRKDQLDSSTIFKDLQQGLPESLQKSLQGVAVSFYFKQRALRNFNENNAREDINYALEFLHKSLKEYMVAEKIFFHIKYTFLGQETYPGSEEAVYKISDHNWAKALREINILFAHPTGIADGKGEITDYLIDIIKNHKFKDNERARLANRLGHFLPEFLKRDFLVKYDIRKQGNTNQLNNNIFYGYWTVLSHLKKGTNFIDEGIVEEFSRRISIGKHPKINLSFQKLSNASLEGVNLSDSNLEGINLDQAKLTGANLEKCNLQSSSLIRAELARTNLRDAKLQGTKLEEADLERADLEGTNLRKSQLRFAILRHVNLRLADLATADLRGAQLQGADLVRADFGEADLRKANFEGANMKLVNLRRAKVDKLNWLDELEVIGILELREKYYIPNELQKDDDTEGEYYIILPKIE